MNISFSPGDFIAISPIMDEIPLQKRRESVAPGIE
jgi:hypothetical protein